MTKIFDDAGLRRVPLERINRDRRDYAIHWPAAGADRGDTPEGTDPALAGPVWVIEETGEAGNILADGFARVEAARKEGLESLPAVVFPAGVDRAELFRARLAADRGTLSAVEISRVAGRLLDNFGLSRGRVASEFLPLMGCEAAEKVLDDLLALGGLEEPVARWCAENGTALREALLWSRFPREGQRALLVLVRAVRPGANLLRSYLRLVDEIALRESVNVQDILTDREITRVMLDSQQARSVGREKVHRILRARRNPELSRIAGEFGRTREALPVSGEVRIEPPRMFEGGKLSLSFEAGSEDELAARAEELRRAVETGGVGRLFEILGRPPSSGKEKTGP